MSLRQQQVQKAMLFLKLLEKRLTLCCTYDGCKHLETIKNSWDS